MMNGKKHGQHAPPIIEKSVRIPGSFIVKRKGVDVF
jgi:hypothetical protein